MSFDNIPDELKQLRQWVCWRLEDIEGSAKPTKVPYDCITGNLASVNDPNSWHSFLDATNAVHKYSGLGFVFTAGDPYAFIDLDNTLGDKIAAQRQLEIYKEFDSYAEISPSGNGLHIIVRGSVPNGRRRSFIEVYSSGRYATFTGHLYRNSPIRGCQEKLTQLWHQMGNGPVAHNGYIDQPEKYNDEEIIRQASSAINAEKFISLQSGRWQGIYPSQSEADIAFINIITFYTKNRNQISRLFQSSALGQRSKAKRSDYVEGMILKAFDRELPPIDFDGFRNQLEEKIASKIQAVNGHDHTPVAQVVETSIARDAGSNPAGSTIPLPPGLLGELAQFIYNAAPRPVPEIALAGAIGLMAGICGRSYNISGTGLNQYVLVLADTGTGKEAMASGIDRLMNYIRPTCPTALGFIGPSEIASGQALIKHLNKVSQCFVSILGEFGIRLHSMSNRNASSSEVGLKRILLDLYNKSGHDQMFRPIIYSDRNNNVDATKSPSFTILGESTPERFYSVLNEDMISEGLLPRFLIIEYIGQRPALNKNAQMADPSNMRENFSAFIANCEGLMHNAKVIDIQAAPNAQKMLDEFDQYATNLINRSDKDIIKQLWNRAHIKVLKLSALIATGVNMIMPTIIPEYVEWSINVVVNDIRLLSAKFEAGLIGLNSDEIKQRDEAIKCIKQYLTKSWDDIKGYCPSCIDLHHAKIIPHEFISTRIGRLAIFKNDRLGPTIAVKRVIQTLIDDGKLEEVTKTKWFQEKFKRQSKRAFVIKPEILE